MKNYLLLIGLFLALVASGLVVNQYVLRFFMDTDILGYLTGDTISAHEILNFEKNKLWYFAYALSLTILLFISPIILHRFSRLQSEGGRAIAGFLRLFLAMSLLAAVSGLIISISLGSPRLGGEAMKFYWTGLAFIMLICISIVSYAFSKGYTIMLRDWIIHLYGIILLPLSIFPLFFLWFYGLNFDIHESMVTAVTIAFAGHFFLSFYITVQLLGHRLNPRT